MNQLSIQSEPLRLTALFDQAVQYGPLSLLHTDFQLYRSVGDLYDLLFLYISQAQNYSQLKRNKFDGDVW